MTDIVVIFCCSLLGYIIARLINNRLRNREMVYEQLALFAHDLANNVQHEKQTLYSFVSSSNKSYRDTILQLLDNNKVDCCSMPSSALEEIRQFIAGLDATNSSALLLHLARYSEIFDNQYSALHSANKTQCSVNGKVGILLGAVLALLLI